MPPPATFLSQRRHRRLEAFALRDPCVRAHDVRDFLQQRLAADPCIDIGARNREAARAEPLANQVRLDEGIEYAIELPCGIGVGHRGDGRDDTPVYLTVNLNTGGAAPSDINLWRQPCEGASVRIVTE